MLGRRLEQDREAHRGEHRQLEVAEENGDKGEKAVAFRAKAETKRVTGMGAGAGSAAGASGAVQGAGVCSTRILTTFRLPSRRLLFLP